MKDGYKHKTGVFGTDGEYYTSKLFDMHRIPNGQRQPDLINIDTSTPLLLEQKTGEKGIMVAYQLQYGIRNKADYEDLFGCPMPKRPDRRTKQQKHQQEPNCLFETRSETQITIDDLLNVETNTRDIAFYYSVLQRNTDVNAQSVSVPFGQLKINWQNMYVVPHSFAFAMFAATKALTEAKQAVAEGKSFRGVKQVAEELRQMMKEDFDNNHSNYQERKDRSLWQDLQPKDILAVWRQDLSNATKEGQQRLDYVKQIYPQLDDLIPLKIEAPNQNYIVILSEPKHGVLFSEELSTIVEKNKPRVEAISTARMWAEYHIGQEIDDQKKSELDALCRWELLE